MPGRAGPTLPLRVDCAGATLVILSAAAFSAKAICIKLAYTDGSSGVSVDPVSLLAMRMEVLDRGVLVPLLAVLYAGYHVGVRQMIKRVGAVLFAALASIVSTLAISLHFMATREVSLLLQQSQRVWVLTGWMALVSTVLPVIMMAEGIRRVGSSNAAMMSSIGPIMTIFMGYQFLGEPITTIQLISAALVMIGVLAISLKKT